MSFHTENTELNVGCWTIVGTSMGGTHTTIVVKELKICFDIGVLTKESINCDKILISHGHIDHCQSYFKHYRCRKIRKMMPSPIYIIPPIMKVPMENSSRAYFNMEKGLVNVPSPKNFIDIISLPTDKEFTFSQYSNRKCYIKGYEMTHGIPAYGYTVVTQVPKLLPEYMNLPGREIGELRKKGADIFSMKKVIQVAYSGDTTITGVLLQEDFLNAKVLILECTIIDDQVSRKETANRGHVHILDIIEHWQKFNNDHIVLFHLSPRYAKTNVRKIIKDAMKELPIEFTQKISVLWPNKRTP